MKKVFVIVILLAFIVLNFSFVILKLQANGSEDNFFNQKYRVKLGKSALMRQVLGLHFDGDARYDYLAKNTEKITIEVDQMESLKIPVSALNLLVQKIKDATGKEVEYLYSDEDISYRQSVDKSEVAQIAEKYKTLARSRPYVYLLYLSSSKQEEDLLGSTFEEYGIVLYADTLRDFTRGSPATFGNYVESTALHEFGHQLGLGHNERQSCLMNASAEQRLVLMERPQDVVTDFCDYEKGLIRQQ